MKKAQPRTAADIMHADVVTVRNNQTIKELAQVLIDHRITGAPVLDESGRLVGVVSQTDLVRRQRESDEAVEVPAYHQSLDRWLGRQGFQVEAPEYARVGDVMTPAVLSADVAAPIEELARMMSRKGIHRIVITREGKLAGIVTSMDLLELVGRRRSSRKP